MRDALIAVLMTGLMGLSGPPAQADYAAHADAIAAVIEREYFDKDVAVRAALALRNPDAQRRYRAATTLRGLADSINRDLFEVTRDKHLAVRLLTNQAPRAASPDVDEERAVRARRANYGVQRVEVLAGNIGYLNLTSFYRPEEAGAALAAAMLVLRDTDALIVDMRENSGGSPETTALLLSYFFDAPGMPLFEIVPREGSSRAYATSDPGVASLNGTRPVYVLTSTRTFSGGEGFAFILQERRRAQVMGETTAGAANAGRPYPVNAAFEVIVPNGRVNTAVTKTNWEGKGVVPDVAVPASDALREAQIKALRELIAKTTDTAWRDRLKRALAALGG